MIRAITFDVGETLVFDRPTRDERVASALDALGIVYSAPDLVHALRAAQEYGMQQYLLGKSIDDPVIVAELLKIILDRVGANSRGDSIRGVARSFSEMQFERYVDPSALALLQDLRGRGFQIGVVSDWEPDLAGLLETLGCRHLLDSVSVSSIVGATKPSPELFHDALDQMRVQPGEALHVGDYWELDVAGARGVGMGAVLYDWRARHGAESAGVPVVRSFPELAALLAALPTP